MAVATYGIQQQALRQNAETDEDRKKRIEQERRLAAYTPSDRSAEELAAQEASDVAKSLRMGDTRYQETGPRGKGLLGAGLAWAMDKATGKKKRAAYSDQALTGLNADRTVGRLKQARLANDRARRDLAGEDETRYMQEDRQAHASEAGSTQEYENLDTGAIVNVVERRDGRLYTTDGQLFDPAGHIPYVPAAAEGSRGTSAAMRLREQQELEDVSVGVFGNSLEWLSKQNVDVLKGSTGKYDWERFVGKYGLAGEDNPFFNRVQEANNVINALTFESAGPMLAKLGIASDNDVKIAFDAAGGENANINTVVGAYKRSVIPTIIGKARARGQMPTEKIDAVEKKLYSYINKMEETLFKEQMDKIQKNPKAAAESESAEINAEIKRIEAQLGIM